MHTLICNAAGCRAMATIDQYCYEHAKRPPATRDELEGELRGRLAGIVDAQRTAHDRLLEAEAGVREARAIFDRIETLLTTLEAVRPA